MTEAPGPLLKRYLASIDRRPRTTIDFLCDINRQLERDVRYLIRMEPGVQTPEETLAKSSGSCRDSGWLLVQLLRHFGLAARFVSGYLIQLTADVKALDGPAGTDRDFTDLHAWAEVYVPGAGWIGLDPTSGLLAGEGHIPLAATPHPVSAAPITGSHEKAEVAFSFNMGVTRIRETPRVTKPYSEETWSRVLESGRRVDARLRSGDVRLSMGGEPTFVAADDMEGAEWNTAAVGPNKRRYADELVRRLQQRFAPGGLIHIGQGKWYPGEQLPRWAFALYWRADGEPLWENPDLIAREIPERAAGIAEAETFVRGLCRQLGLPADSALPAYEDAAHFMLIEQKLPLNVSAKDNALDDPAERNRVMRVFDRGLGAAVSYVLPIQAWQTQDRGRRWVTERWALRREKLFLMPGDSPAGFRLPLGSMPVLEAVDYPHVLPRDPFAPAPPLPERTVILQRRRTVTLEAPPPPPAGRGDIFGSVRTALTIEPRDGHLCVFLPPLEDAEDYAALVAAVEETARSTGLGVHVEGYTPPPDPRLNVIKVTPDPGVIEVNVHPCTDWPTAVEITTALYEEAHKSRLGAQKFMIDGRHTGTGGGNHIVLGGITPADSPFLRRPDLLASVIAYWQNHPSLSYLFSGLFIGPTSQAPRIDEARHESLHELEIALSEIPGPGSGSVSPWLVDRIFRHLLIDVSGNTHRAEICIDKLYSPDGPTGRLGLVEFRSFEMPPACAHEPRPAAPAARADRHVLGEALSGQAGALGHRTARPVHAAALPLGRLRRRRRGPPPRRPAGRARLVPATLRVPLPPLRRVRRRRRRDRASPGARAVARAGRGRLDRRHRALCRLLARARAGQGARPHRRPVRRHLQRPRRAAHPDRKDRGGGSRHPLPRLVAAFRTAPDHSPACTARH